MSTPVETLPFQTETKQLLDILIHALYSHKEIFLRELISNASDALDRVRLEALTDSQATSPDEKLEIRLDTDPVRRTLTVHDNGIGMSRDEVISNIGTVAKSGTRELMEKLKETRATEAIDALIGQFGVGFYSVFMVANEVTLITRRAGAEKATRWTSTGDGTYQIAEDSRFQHGTTITLQLKPVDKENGIDDFTDYGVLRSLIKRYSDFVAYPILAKDTRTSPEVDPDGKPIPGKTRTVTEEKTLNSMQPIWTRPQADVKTEEYAEFYKHISHDWSDPLDRLRLKAEGRLDYQALLFFPSKAPFDLYYRDQTYGLQLYVRRVLIMDHCKDLLPIYLRFVKGVVDSADLPLNVSREMVQHDRHITQMRSWLTRKILDHLKQRREEDKDRFLSFWKEFGQVFKEGVHVDRENKDRIVDLLLFQSSSDPETLTSLAEYVERMKPDQSEIYYLTGESRTVVEDSPHLEALKAKGYEVLYLVDPVDELLTEAVTEYNGKTLKSVGRGTVELGTEEEKKQAEERLEEKKGEFGDLLKFLERVLDKWIKEARLSTRLTTSPVCLVGAEDDLSPHLERLLRRTQGEGAIGHLKRILELNPEHELLIKLGERFRHDPTDPALDDYAHLLLGYGLLAEGSQITDPARFNRAVSNLMVKGL